MFVMMMIGSNFMLCEDWGDLIGVDENCNGFKYCNLKLDFCGDE